MNKKFFVGISGRKRQGKDTAATFIGDWCSVHGHPCSRRAFADIVRECIVESMPFEVDLEYFDFTGDSSYDRDRDDVLKCFSQEQKHDIMEEWVDSFVSLLGESGYQPHCDIPKFESGDVTIRRLLQYFGTDVGKNCFDSNIWIDMTLCRFEKSVGYIILSDVRFDDEAEAIRNRGGIIIEVFMNTETVDDSHASEAGISDHLIDIRVENRYGYVSEFASRIKNIVENINATIDV